MKKIIFLFLLFFKLLSAESEMRIISLSHFSTIILIQLEQEKNLIGQGWNSGIAFPDEIQEKLKNIPNLSDGIPTREKIYSLSPTLLVGWKSAFSSINLGTKEELKTLGIESFFFDSASAQGNIEMFFNDLRKLGKILNIEKKIEEKIFQIDTILNNIEKREKLETIVFISNIEKTPSAIGGKGLIQSIIEKAGYINIFKDIDKNYFNTDWEVLVNNDFDNLVILATDEKDFVKKYHKIIDNGYFNDKKAIKNKNVFYLNYIDTAPNLNIGKTAENLSKKNLKNINELLK